MSGLCHFYCASPIERIQPGMLVLARDEADSQGPVVARRVLETFVTHPTQLRHLTVRTLDGTPETLSGTPNHPFYSIRHGGFVEAGELQIGDELSLADGRTAHVTAVRDEAALPGQTFTTYNFTVEEHHTYFVGRTGIWVHNTGNPCDALTAKFIKFADESPDAAGKTTREIYELFKKQDHSDILTPDFDADQLARHWDDVEGRLFNPTNRKVRIVDTDGAVVELLATTAKGNVTVITEMVKDGDDLILNGLHIDGPGAGSLGVSGLRELAKDLGRQQGVKRVIIHGGVRTTGANPGHTPRPIIIIVD